MILLFIAVLMPGCQEEPETAETVALRVVLAHGGAAAINEARGFLFHGHVQGMTEKEHGKLWILYRQPEALRVIVETTELKEERLYLQGRGWIDRGSGFQPVSGLTLDLLRFQADHLGIISGLQEKRFQLTLLEGSEEGGMTRLKLVDSGGESMVVLIDPINSVVRKVERILEIQGEKVTFGVLYEDYRPVKGVQMPFRKINFVNGQLVGRSDFQSVQANPSIPEKVFSMPRNGAIQ